MGEERTELGDMDSNLRRLKHELVRFSWSFLALSSSTFTAHVCYYKKLLRYGLIIIVMSPHYNFLSNTFYARYFRPVRRCLSSCWPCLWKSATWLAAVIWKWGRWLAGTRLSWFKMWVLISAFTQQQKNLLYGSMTQDCCFRLKPPALRQKNVPVVL